MVKVSLLDAEAQTSKSFCFLLFQQGLRRRDIESYRRNQTIGDSKWIAHQAVNVFTHFANVFPTFWIRTNYLVAQAQIHFNLNESLQKKKDEEEG